MNTDIPTLLSFPANATSCQYNGNLYFSGRADDGTSFGVPIAFRATNRNAIEGWPSLEIPGLSIFDRGPDIVAWVALTGQQTDSHEDHIDLAQHVWDYVASQIACRGGSVVRPSVFGTIDRKLPLIHHGAGEITPDMLPAREVDYFAGVTLTELLQTDYSVEWIIPNFWPARQPGVIGGSSKSLKTSVCMDAAIAIATGTPFLGQFPTNQKRVRFISGESGDVTLQNLAARICRERQLPQVIDDLVISSHLPRITDADDMRRLERTIRRERIDVLILDPLYKCGLAKAASQGLYGMGEALYAVSDICQQLGVSLATNHHNTKEASKRTTPPSLLSLQESGIEQWARWWWLLGRREAYRPDRAHELWAVVGGSIGHSSLWELSIDEGPTNALGLRTKWTTRIIDHYTASGQTEAERFDVEKQAVLAQLNAAGPLVKTKIQKAARIRKSKTDEILSELMREKKIVQTQQTIKKRKYTVYQLRKADAIESRKVA